MLNTAITTNSVISETSCIQSLHREKKHVCLYCQAPLKTVSSPCLTTSDTTTSKYETCEPRPESDSVSP